MVSYAGAGGLAVLPQSGARSGGEGAGSPCGWEPLAQHEDTGEGARPPGPRGPGAGA